MHRLRKDRITYVKIQSISRFSLYYNGSKIVLIIVEE